MKSKLLICAAIVLGVSGVVGASYLYQQDATVNVAERMAT